MGKDIKRALAMLKTQGFTLVHGEGNRIKVYPQDKTKPFYSLHANDKSFHPLRRFAKTNWGIELKD